MEIKIMGLRRDNATFPRNFIPFHIFFSISTFTTTRSRRGNFWLQSSVRDALIMQRVVM